MKVNLDAHRSRPSSLVLVAVVAVAGLVLATAALTATLMGRTPALAFGGMMAGFGGPGGGDFGGHGGMMGGGYGGMMGGSWSGSSPAAGPQPGESGFVAGTPDAPRIVRVLAGPGYAFFPSSITVARGETVTFVVTTMGPLVHEFMIGPAADVANDREGTPEISDIGMMQTETLTYTFDGTTTYAFACHAPGHYEAGMRGVITVVD